MDKIAEHLIQKETITGKEFMKIFREVKGIPEPEEDGKAAEAGKEGGDEAVRAQMKPAEAKEDAQPEQPEENARPAGTEERTAGEPETKEEN